MSNLSIVMYHYVRDMHDSPYPRLKGLDLKSFRRQLDFFQENYSFITAENLVEFIREKRPLPEKACWLTFDDGYRDHYQYVLPELLLRGIQGAFFAPAKPIEDREMLDVNKIHFILAAVNDVDLIVDNLQIFFIEHNLNSVIGKSFNDFWLALAKPNRFDTANVVFVKRMLQFALPEKWRKNFTDLLFLKYVGSNTNSFADELYMTSMQLRELVQAGMYVGAHGYRHLWLSKETYKSQLDEVQRSLAFLGRIGAPTNDWIMCYPWGDYNNDTLDIIGNAGAIAGLTIKAGIANLGGGSSLELPRFDTNDFPS